MATDGSIILMYALAIGALYLMALGIGMVMGQQRGVAYVNRITRRLLAWPVEMLGRLLLGIANVIRG